MAEVPIEAAGDAEVVIAGLMVEATEAPTVLEDRMAVDVVAVVAEAIEAALEVDVEEVAVAVAVPLLFPTSLVQQESR